MKKTMTVLCSILLFPFLMLYGIIMTIISHAYMDYLHNKDDPTKEEWKIKL